MNAADIDIRRAQREEVAAIAAISVETWETAYRGIVPEDFFAERRARGEDEARWWEALEREGHGNAVAAEEGRILGYATWTLEGEIAELAALYVVPPAWGRGLGGKLYRHVGEQCRSAGVKRLAIWTLGGNERAQRFYRSMGARRTGQERFFPLLPELELPEIRLEHKLE
ncbi:MAG: N-acetyltransferase family protein [Sandaracinaceae bacterium]